MQKETQDELGFKKVIEVGDIDPDPDMAIKIEGKKIVLQFNPTKMFSTLYHKDIVPGVLKGVLEELVSKHLYAMKLKESNRQVSFGDEGGKTK